MRRRRNDLIGGGLKEKGWNECNSGEKTLSDRWVGGWVEIIKGGDWDVGLV